MTRGFVPGAEGGNNPAWGCRRRTKMWESCRITRNTGMVKSLILWTYNLTTTYYLLNDFLSTRTTTASSTLPTRRSFYQPVFNAQARDLLCYPAHPLYSRIRRYRVKTVSDDLQSGRFHPALKASKVWNEPVRVVAHECVCVECAQRNITRADIAG